MMPCGIYQPTLEGFQDFITNVMQVPADALPVDSPYIASAFRAACGIVLRCLRGCDPFLYQQAVYNLAASILIQYTPDQPCMSYFAAYRQNSGIGSFTPGVISSSSDSSTSQSWVVPDFMKNLTLGDLQNLKNPYGMAYLAIAQDYGNIWGLT